MKMPRYRVHRIKDIPREHFRWAPHTGGIAVAKAKDYAPAEEMTAQNPYELWKLMAAGDHPLHPGDLLELLGEAESQSAPQLWIAKYIGFEPAQWFVPVVAAPAIPATSSSVDPSNQKY